MFICSCRRCVVENVLPKKTEILKGRGFTIMEFRGHGGVTHFGISEGKGGLKHGSRPWLGMDIFWNCPFSLSGGNR